MLARVQDCSYNSFKNFHTVLSKCMKNGQFLNFYKVISKCMKMAIFLNSKSNQNPAVPLNFLKCIVVMQNATLDLFVRLQDCSYNSFKNVHKVLLKYIKNSQFLNLEVSPKFNGSTNFLKKMYCANVEYHSRYTCKISEL